MMPNFASDEKFFAHMTFKASVWLAIFVAGNSPRAKS
jgi:hypothetical protein